MNINYRLLPKNMLPDQAHDARDALAGVANNIARHGGDPEQDLHVGPFCGREVGGALRLACRLPLQAGWGVIGAVMTSGGYESREGGIYGARSCERQFRWILAGLCGRDSVAMKARDPLKTLYRALVPESIRGSTIIARLKLKLVGHDWLYDRAFYQLADEAAARAAGAIAGSVVRDLKPRSAVDVGCGAGALLAALRSHGCDAFGLEYAEAGLRECRRRQLAVAKFDLETHRFSGRTFDIAVSMEVAEHLHAATADRFVDLLARLSGLVVFTAARPGQGGIGHINEQPPAYWIAKFHERGFHTDDALAARWQQEWCTAAVVADFYWRNLIIFRRALT